MLMVPNEEALLGARYVMHALLVKKWVLWMAACLALEVPEVVETCEVSHPGVRRGVEAAWFILV